MWQFQETGHSHTFTAVFPHLIIFNISYILYTYKKRYIHIYIYIYTTILNNILCLYVVLY